MKKPLALFVLGLGLTISLPGVTWIQGFDPSLHERFYQGVDRNFIGEGLDFSGVGWTGSSITTRRWATLIADDYVIGAWHWRPSNGDTLTFNTGNLDGSNEVTLTIDTGSRIGGTDLWLGKLTASAPGSLARYPIYDLGALSNYDGQELLVYGQEHRLGTNHITRAEEYTEGSSTSDTVVFDYDTAEGTGEAYLNAYDSGGPTFTEHNGELSIVGIHWSVSGTAYGEPALNDPLHESIDTLIASSLDDLIAITGPGELSTVPEPAASPLLLGLLALLFRKNNR